jgi:hypothetical protein
MRKLAIGTSGEPGPANVAGPGVDPCEAMRATRCRGTLGLPGAVAISENRR